MTIILNGVAWLAALALLLPLAVLTIECWAALLPRRRESAAPTIRPCCAVVIPAHNEEAGLPATLDSVRGQLRPGDRVVVVADNCTDGTEAAARAGGAEVVVRHDPNHRGKGYALHCGETFLSTAPPPVVVFVDADCTLAAGALDWLVDKAATTGRPIQAAFLAVLPPAADARAAVSAFAWRLKNLVRPLGLSRLGLPCMLTGSGMALPWPTLAYTRLANGNIVEDMQLGLDLAEAGHAALFCPAAQVRSTLPAGRDAARTQRTRWEHGHLQTLLRRGPSLIAAGLYRGNVGLVGVALDLCVPPLSLLLLLSIGVLGMLTAAWALGLSSLPALTLAGGLGLALLTLVAVWLRFNERELLLRTLLALPGYVLGKVPIYTAFLWRRQQEWVRTDRAGAPPL